MRPQISRLPANTGKGFAGSEIDRSRPIEFRLAGRVFSALAGDTVLTALLASGVDTVGLHRSQPIGLRHGSSPAIAPVGARPDQALPMDRVPARHGADFQLVAPHKRSNMLTRLFQPGRTLGLTIDEMGRSLVRPWLTLPGERQPAADLIVIGGGVSGMSAALAAAQAGLAVTLIEASPLLGGHSGLFGTQDGDATPQDQIDRLATEIKASPAITIRTNCEVFAIAAGLVRAHQIEISNSPVTGLVIDIPTRHIVIATGAIERLPVIPGNRRPGVMGAQEAFELARRYGIWPGHSFMVSTSANPAYRLATLLAETGLRLDRITDGREQASSRYIEFCKAHGFRLFPGTVPKAIEGSDGRLTIDLPHGEPVSVDRLILSGGWQPDLTLWHMAGGQSRWNMATQRLEPIGPVEGIVLAGAAAGYFTRRGCTTSGTAAIDRLLGRKGRGVDDPVIEALYETPDGHMSQSDAFDTDAVAYLGAETTLALRSKLQRRPWRSTLLNRQGNGTGMLAESPQPLSISAIASGVVLGLIPPESAGVVAQERVALIPLAAGDAPDIPASTEVPLIPAYLRGRFGPDAMLAHLAQSEARRFESGALIFLDHDTTDPLGAIGVVLRMRDEKIEALIAKPQAQPGTKVVVRDLGQSVQAEVKS